MFANWFPFISHTIVIWQPIIGPTHIMYNRVTSFSEDALREEHTPRVVPASLSSVFAEYTYVLLT